MATEDQTNILQDFSDIATQLEHTWTTMSSVRSAAKAFKPHLSPFAQVPTIEPKKTPAPKKKRIPAPKKKSGIICGDCSEDCGNHYKVGGVSGRYYCEGCWEYIENKYCMYERYSHTGCDVCVAYRQGRY